MESKLPGKNRSGRSGVPYKMGDAAGQKPNSPAFLFRLKRRRMKGDDAKNAEES